MGEEDTVDDWKYELLLSGPPLWKNFKPKSEIEDIGFWPDICKAPVTQPELFVPLELEHETFLWGLAVKPSEEVPGSYSTSAWAVDIST
jgi:hypothetical protein